MTNIQFKLGDAVQLRNGWDAKVLDVVEGQEYCVFLRYRDGDGKWDFISVRADGRYLRDEKSPLDLIHKPKRMSGFVNVYQGYATGVFTNRASADIDDRHATFTRIACIDLSQFEEGEGL